MSADLVRARIDEGPVVPLMWLVVCLGFLLNLADGIDVVAMSVTAPSVAASWGLDRAALGPLFSSALFGMAIGAAGLAPLQINLVGACYWYWPCFWWGSVCSPLV